MTQPPAVTSALPDHAVVPASGRATPTSTSTVARAPGSSPATARATSTTRRASASRTRAMPTRAWRPPSPRRRASLIHGQQNIVYHEPGLRLYERLAAAPARRALAGRPGQLRHGGRGGHRQAGPGRHGSHGHPRLPLRLPRPHRPVDGADERAQAAYRSAFEPLPAATYLADLPFCYRAPGGPHRPDACTLRLGGAPRPPLRTRSSSPSASRPSSSSRSSARAATSCRRRRSCRACARSRASTASSWPPTRSRPGFGRTGRLFAVEHVGVEPDILIVAKGIASGLPLVGHRGAARPAGAWGPGMHGGTYGGNVVSCAAALATLDVIEEEGLVANAADAGRPAAGGPPRARDAPPGDRGRPWPRAHGRPSSW